MAIGRDDDRTQVRHHIEFKATMRELDPTVAARMLAALDTGADPDYATLLEQATFLPPPAICYHTAPVSARDNIARDGLRPANGTNWGDKATGQPTGVYVGPNPDHTGVWAHWNDWDIWAIDMTGLDWQHDRLNPGSWILPAVPAHQVTLYAASQTHPSAR